MKKFDFVAILLFILAFAILIYKIEKPFWGQFDWTGAWFGTIARNYLQIDVSKSLLAPITVSGTTEKTLWSYYNHYSITYPLITAGSLYLFGVHEWSIRIVPVVFSVLFLIVFYLLCRRFYHPLVGIFGIISTLVTPMFIYYGKLPVHEQAVLFLSLAAVYFYSSKNIKWMTIFTTLALMVSWTGVYILLLITVHGYFTQKNILRKFLPAYLILLLIPLVHLLHIQISSNLNDFGRAISDRTSSGGSPITFVIKQIKWSLALYTKPLFIISLLSLIYWKKPIMLMFFVWGFFQWFVVNKIMWIHDYMLIYFLPFFAFTCGYSFYQIWKKNQVFCFVLISLVLFFSVYTSFPFTNALLNSRDQTGDVYPVAKYLKENSIYGDKIFVVSDSNFEIRYPVHYFSYYSDRYIKYGSLKELNTSYKYIIVKDEKINDKKLIQIFGSFFIYEN